MRLITGTLGALICAPLSLVMADTVTIPAARDTTLYQDDLGSISNGAGAYFFAGVNGGGEIRRGLIRFDVASAIPPGASIQSVSVRLRMSRTNIAAPIATVSLHRTLADWGEGLSNAPANEGGGAVATPGDATWLNNFFPGSFWTDPQGLDAPGGVFSPDPSAQLQVSGVNVYTWTGPGLVADVQAWMNDPSSNFGWTIIGDESQPTTAKRFDSRENATVANRPSITITYALQPPCPCDFNHTGNVNSQDLFDFITAFFQLAQTADFNHDSQINSQDFFDFVTCFFARPPGCA